MKKDERRAQYFKKYAIVTLLVLEIVIFVIVGMGVGDYLDRQWIGQGNMGVALGGLLGFGLGIYKFYSDTKRFLK
ncbi:MAG: hypothetical protein HYY61_03135 [Deltaproteobacteria bacterium]|nr:hypothetical protein [Deltaproteobacteria bacterium]